MVFLLNDDDVLYILGHNKTYYIGRSRQNNIRIKDSSVSRRHAEITTQSIIAVIKDLKSFRGTRVNNKLITEEQLVNGDSIKVGLFNRTLVFRNSDFKVDIDCNLTTGTKEMLKLAVEELHIEYGSPVNFEDVTHFVTELVTMQSLKNSPILLYLLGRKLIITPQYFTAMLAGINDPLPIPNFYKFLPPADEYLQSKGFTTFTRSVLKANRSSLFKDVVFISFHNIGHLGTFLSECGGSLHEYHSGSVFIDTLYEVFANHMYDCVLIQGPESVQANIKVCKLRLQKEIWKNVQQVNEDDLYLSVLQCCKIGFKPVLQNCQEHCSLESVKVQAAEDNDKSSHMSKRWLSKKKPINVRFSTDPLKSREGENKQVTALYNDDDDEATSSRQELIPVIQNKAEEGKTKSPLSKIGVKEPTVLESGISLTSAHDINVVGKISKSSGTKRPKLVKNPIAIKRLKLQSSKEPLEDNLTEKPTSINDETTTSPKKFAKLNALQNKYKHLTITPIVNKTS